MHQKSALNAEVGKPRCSTVEWDWQQSAREQSQMLISNTSDDVASSVQQHQQRGSNSFDNTAHNYTVYY